MKRLKYTLLSLIAACVLASCSLTYEDIVLQMMRKSHSGLDLRGKSISAFVIYNGAQDSVACYRAMYDFIGKMSTEYGQPINIYTMKDSGGEDYLNTRAAAGLLTEAGTDVIFFSVPSEEDGEAGFRIYAYDSMCEDDTIMATQCFKQDSIFVSSTTNHLVSLFGPNWSTGVFRILFYDGSEDWMEACSKAMSGEWTSAISKWMSILEDSQSLDKRAAAEYNIALGCYLTGEFVLSAKWLSQAESDCLGTRTPDYMNNLKVLINKEIAEGKK